MPYSFNPRSNSFNEEQEEPVDITDLLSDIDNSRFNKKRFSPKSLLKNTVLRINESSPVKNAKDFSKTFAENLRTSLNLDAPVYERAKFPVGSNPIFKDLPQFKMPRAKLAAGFSALPGVIPSAEVIKATAEGGPLAGIGEHAKEKVMSVPTSVAVGLGAYLVPGASRFVPGVAGGVALKEVGRSLQEASRQLTGESALSKIQQTIGTKPRTGFATSTPQETYQRAQQRVDNPPQIKPLTRPVPRSNQINRQSSSMDEFKRRARMAGSRFNPLKGEFGLTEMLFGR